MFIKTILLEGACGEVAIRRTETGAVVIADRVEVAVGRSDSQEDRFGVALNVARFLYGEDRRGRVNATNSMVHEVLGEIDRVAGC
jgi:hypothetical protein